MEQIKKTPENWLWNDLRQFKTTEQNLNVIFNVLFNDALNTFLINGYIGVRELECNK